MKIIKARFRSGKDFLDSFEDSEDAPSLFCATTHPLEEKEQVVVEIHFPELPNKMMLRGEVTWWRSALPRMRVRAGALVRLLPEERNKKEFILSFAGGEKREATKRRHPRIPVALPIQWRAVDSTQLLQGELRDLSVGGALLVTDQRPPVESEIIIELTTPGGAHPMDIAARVTHEGTNGVGVRFLYRNGGGSQRLREMVRRVVNSD